MGIQYTNNSAKVKAAMKGSVMAFLHEIAGEIQGQAIRLSRTDTGQTKGSYETKVIIEGDTGTAYIGSNYQNAIWEEYGTGEYALQGNGRKGGWVFKFPKTGKFIFTRGKKPNRPLFLAFQVTKGNIANRLKEILQSNIGG